MTTDDDRGRRADDDRGPPDDARGRREQTERERPAFGGRLRSTDRDAVDRLFGSLPTVRVSRLPDDEHE